MSTQLIIQNTDADAETDQMRDQNVQVTLIIEEKRNLSQRLSWLHIRISYNSLNQNIDFGALMNDIAALKTAFTALETKVSESKEDLNKLDKS
jgi:hypothetical protein